MGEVARHDAAAYRASDADRELVAERLREAAGEGRLTLDELEERLGQVYRALTYGELDALVADLPAGPGLAPGGAPGDPEVLRLSAGGSRRTKTGSWVVPPTIVASAGMSDVKLDFTEAVCRHRVVQVEARAWAGNVVLVVPRGWSVLLDEVSSSLGSVKDKVTAPAAPGAPTIVVRGHAAMGNVVARHPRASRLLPR
jgi:hypothetical protein